LLARFTSTEPVTHVHANSVRDTHTYTYSYSHLNSAAYAHTQRQSNTKGSPNSASAPVILGNGESANRQHSRRFAVSSFGIEELE
jgi:hypothetical protein